MSQIKFSFVKPPSNYDITGTREGIISRTGNKSKNIILFPGQSDYILRQNNREVWPNNIQNIISRVTGGNLSYIDGRLRSTIPNADLYFLNPA